MYLSVKQHVSSLLFHDYYTTITIKPISPYWKKNITPHLFCGLLFSKIAFQAGLVKSTVCQVHHIIQPERPRLYGDHPSKLTPTNKQAIIHLIVNYKAKHAVLANQFIHYIIVSPVCVQAMRTSSRGLIKGCGGKEEGTLAF
ncbi:hypothetical protein ID866_7454 [Astraeus odoratus]|nr:hypothetical protein ID866_7454 [Astraeus odoratus]